MSALSDLISKLEAATGGSRELDRDIALVTGWSVRKVLGCDEWWHPTRGCAGLSHYTTSIDSALPWEGEGFWEISGRRQYLHIPTESPNRWRAEFWYGPPLHAEKYVGWGATEPLARRIAALKARS